MNKRLFGKQGWKVQKIFVKHFIFGFTCSTSTAHLYLLFIIVTWIAMHLVSSVMSSFYSSFVEMSRLLSEPCHHRLLNLVIVEKFFPTRISVNLENK
jgi:hypothetical protein